MKTIIVFAVVAVLVCANCVMGQNAPIYDQNYRGPVNIYGQPAYSVAQQQNNAQQQQQQPGGLVPAASNVLYGIGNYFWGFLPAPVRGEESKYYVPQGSGQVNTYFVPGTR